MNIIGTGYLSGSRCNNAEIPGSLPEVFGAERCTASERLESLRSFAVCRRKKSGNARRDGGIGRRHENALETEWRSFPEEQNLKTAARELERWGEAERYYQIYNPLLNLIA